MTINADDDDVIEVATLLGWRPDEVAAVQNYDGPVNGPFDHHMAQALVQGKAPTCDDR